MALHACPRCKRLIPVGVPYCDDCRPAAAADAEISAERRNRLSKQKAAKNYSAKRNPKLVKFYNSKEWKSLSRWYLSSLNYKCEAQLEGCQRVACEVHHKIPIKTPDGWNHRLDPGGLMGLCTACHTRLEPRYKKDYPGVVDLRKLK